jgi:serine/threonine protein kinase/tetratricopeptide (TPR) repeat protein
MSKNKVFINRYKVIDKLGQGGMGMVWRVYDDVEKKEVALKEIKLQEMDSKLPAGSFISLTSSVTKSSEAELRFSEEFRTMTKLQYPYTVKVFDYGILDNSNKYITMEIVEGENLRVLLETKKLDYPDIYKILIQLAQTINFIHSRLYVHRDIKSDNIIITKTGDIKLMDFGLMDRMGIQSTGKLTGTINYMPLEVPKGGVIDARSDLYSIGCFGYELITGHTPFTGNSAVDIIKQHVNVVPKKLTLLRDDVPTELEGIIYKLLEKEQADRYQTAAELIGDLQKHSDVELLEESLEQRKSYLFCSEIIGREENIQRLQTALEAVKNKEGWSVFIGAPAGVGKTRLINEFKLTAQLSELPFLESACVEQGMEPYHPMKEIFKKVVPLTKKEILDKYGSILVKILPQLRSKGYTPASVLDDGEAEKMRLIDNMTNWLKEVAEYQSFIMCIDDIHWVDSSSIELLNECVRVLNERPVMILCAFRDDEVEETSPVFYTMEEEITQFEKLSTLTKEDVGLLINTMLGHVDLPEEFDEHMYTVTGGNAFFVTETMRSLIEEHKLRMEKGTWVFWDSIEHLDIPTSIEETVSRRLKLLSQDAYEIAQIASVYGKEQDLSVLKEVSGLATNAIFKLIDELIERQFVLKEDKRYIFTHDRVRETLYQGIDDDKKKNLHHKIAEVLERKNKNNPEVVASLLAYHYYRGLDQQKAVRYLIISANQLYKSGVLADCAQTYKAAIQLLENINYPGKERIMFDIRFRISKFAFYTDIGFTIESVAKLKKHIYEMVGGEQKLLNMIKLMKVFYKLINKLPRSWAMKIKSGLGKEHPYPPKPKNYIQAYFQKLIPDMQFILPKIITSTVYEGTAYMFKGEYQKNLEIYDYVCENYLPERKTYIEATIVPGRATTLSYLGESALRKKEAQDSVDALVECTEKYGVELNRDQWSMFQYDYMFVNNYLAFNGMPINKDYHEKGMAISRRIGDLGGEVWLTNAKYSSEAFRGIHKEFDKTMNMAEEINKKLGRPHEMYKWNTALQCYDSVMRGRLDLAEKQIEKARKLTTKFGTIESYDGSIVEFSMGQVLFERGKIEEAKSQWEFAAEFCRRKKLAFGPMQLNGLFYVYMRTGDVDDARKVAEEAHKRVTSERYESPLHQIHSYRMLGFLALHDKDYENAEELCARSAQIAKESDNPIQLGITSVAQAELYMSLQQYNKSNEFLDRAEDVFQQIENDYQIEKVKVARKELQSKIREI